MTARRLAVARHALALGLAGLLAACGFHPVYTPAGSIDPLHNVYVDIIPLRNGQELRQSLQTRLDGTSPDNPHTMVLSVAYGIAGQAVGIQHDNTATRSRVTGTANWTLRKPGPGGATLASGVARIMDGADQINGQFFYSDLESDAINRRMADNIADQIVLGVARWLSTHPQPGAPG